MLINLSPINSVETISAIVNGDTIHINGDEFDFSFIPEGASLPASATGSEYFFGEITRLGGVINVSMFLPYRGGGHFDCPAYIEVGDGDVEFPQHTLQPEQHLDIEVPDAN